MALGEYGLAGFGSTRLQPVAGFRPSSSFEAVLSAIPAANAVTEAEFANRALQMNERQMDRARQQENWEKVNDPNSDWDKAARRQEARRLALGFLTGSLAGRRESGSVQIPGAELARVPTMAEMLNDHDTFTTYRDRQLALQRQQGAGAAGATANALQQIGAN
jgi:hypothetical protein